MSKYPGRVITDLADAGHSVFFNGSSHLSVANNTALDLGSGDFTIEGWWYFNDTSNQSMVSKYSGGAGYVVQQHGSTLRLVLGVGGSDAVSTFAWTPVVGVWYHVAITRSGTSGRAFVNGTQVGTTVTLTTSNTAATVALTLGFTQTTSEYTRGNLSNFRFTKGTALYTANFNAPTQLFPVTNTQLLTCQSPSFVDNSTNAFSITVGGGTPTTSTFTPFAAYNPYNPALGASTPGVWTLDEALQAKVTRQWNMYDPHFNRTSLLLRSGATDGSQNNTFQDSSSNNFTITRSGNTTQGTFTPFSQTGWGIRTCDRNYLTIPASSDFDLINTDFTVEFWVNVNAFNTMAFSGSNFFGNGLSTANNGWSMGFAGSGTTVTSIEYRVFASGAQSANTFSGLAFNLGTWNHIVLQRNGSGSNNLRLFVNGIQQGAAQTAVTYSSAGSTFVLGSGSYLQNLTYSGNADYYISNVRLTRSAIYSTSGFTSPASDLSQLSGTTLLICQSNRLINNGTNTGAVTPTTLNVIPVEVVAFSPFYPTAAYTPETIGGSGYFDGTGDYLRTPSITIGTNAFCFECWFYPTAAQPILAGFFAATTNNALQLSYTNTGAALGIAQRGVAFRVTGSSIPVVNQWNHIAFVRSGTGSNQTSIFLNGVRIANGTSSDNFAASAYDIAYNSGDNAYLTGYISGARLTNGSTPYDATLSTLTIPTAPPTTSASNTVLLLNFTNAAITDATGKSVLETVGNAQASTAVRNTRLVTTPPTAMYFDGSGDYLQVGPNRLFDFGVGDFTIEFWIYPTSFASVTYPMYSTTARAKSDHLAFEVGTAGTIVAYVTASGGGAWSIMSGGNVGTLTLNTWNHVALVRNGSNFRGYVNGVQGGMTNSSTSAVAAFDGFSIGAYVAAGFFTGYMDDIRVTRGVARYTAAFTPPRSRLQEQ